MEIGIKCPWCNREYTVDTSIIGQTVRCISCDKLFKAESISSRSISSYMIERMKSACFPDNSIEYSSSDDEDSNETGNKISDFFDFKIMVLPFFVRLSFSLEFIAGSFAILILPFIYLKQIIDVNNPVHIMLFALGYLMLVIIGIPLTAIILHTFYELTMIPFSILDVLKEINNKLDEKTKR